MLRVNYISIKTKNNGGKRPTQQETKNTNSWNKRHLNICKGVLPTYNKRKANEVKSKILSLLVWQKSKGLVTHWPRHDLGNSLSHTLLPGGQIGTTSMKVTGQCPSKLHMRIVLNLTIPLLGNYIHTWMWCCIHKDVSYNIVCNSKRLGEKAYLSFTQDWVKPIMMHPHHRIFSCLLKEQVCPICINVAESPMYSEKKQGSEQGVTFVTIWMCMGVEGTLYACRLVYALNASRRIERKW